MARISSTQARKPCAQLLYRVSYGQERNIIERAGKAVTALVSEKDAQLLEKIEDRIDIVEARKMLAEGNEPIPHEVRKEFGL